MALESCADDLHCNFSFACLSVSKGLACQALFCMVKGLQKALWHLFAKSLFAVLPAVLQQRLLGLAACQQAEPGAIMWGA
jgi:hypothetical protein